MLSAIVHGKRRGSGLEDIAQGLATATGSEDLLTSLVFERLGYLSDDALDAFWQALLPGRPSFGPIQNIEFWPRLELGEQLVEPDVLVETSNALLVVEAKRWDQVDMQSVPQVARELLAVSKGECNIRELPMVALLVGGRQDTSSAATSAFEAQVQELLVGEQSTVDVEAVAVKWADILKAFDVTANLHPGCRRLREDIERGLRFHGLARHVEVYLHDLSAVGIVSRTFPLHVPDRQSESASRNQPTHFERTPPLRLRSLTTVNIASTRFSFST